MTRLRHALVSCLALALSASVSRGQVLTESFTGTTASGWVMSGTGFTPVLTAGSGIDTVGNGWLRLTSTGQQQATSAYYNTAFNAVGATVYASFDYATWGGTGADGIAFFLFDGDTTFQVGAPGGSLGYANRNAEAGMAGGYIGVGIDEFGNYAYDTEGKIGGIGFTPDNISVRGSEASGYAYLGGSGGLSTSIDTPGVSTRPTIFNQVQILLNATNQLTVTLQQGGSSPQTILQMDLSAFERPETLKLGFASGTGGQTNFHEIRNVQASTIAASLWSNALGTSSWASSNNWNPTVTPGNGEDILFDNTHVSVAQTIDTVANRNVRSITFDAPFDYTINNNTLTFDNGGVAGFSGIAATQTHGTGNHAINSNIAIANDIYVRNSNTGTLTLGGNLATNGHTVTFDGTGGTTTAAGVVSGSGKVIKNDSGILTLAGANTYTGGTTLNNGTLNANSSTALGSGTLSLNGGTLASTNSTTIGNAITLTNNATIANLGATGTLTQSGGDYTLGLDHATLGAVKLSNNNTGRTLTTEVTGSSTIAGVISNGGSGAGNLTKTGSGTLTLSGANTYTGTTTISEGTITLGASNRLNDASDVVLGTGASLNLNGYSERIDKLTAAGGASIDFGTPGGANQFLFSNYTAPSSGVLVINNWENGVDQLATTVSGQNVSTIYLSGYGVAEQKYLTSIGSYGNGYLLGVKAVTEKEWDGSSNGTWTDDSNWTWWGDPNSDEVALFGDLGLGRTSVNLDASRTLAGIKFDTDATSTYHIASTTSDITLSGTVPYIQQKSNVTQELYFDDLFMAANTVVDITGAGDLVINADIKETGGARALIKDGTGAGKLIINSDYSQYSGGLYINNGIVQSRYSGALGSGTGHIADGGALELSNAGTTTNNIQLAGDGVSSGGAIHNVAGTNTLSGTLTETADTRFVADSGTTLNLTGNLTGSNTTTTFAGTGNINVSQITTGTGAVNVETGTTTFTGGSANTYTGATTVSSGATLNLNKSSGVTAIGTGGLTVNSGTVTLQQNNQIADTAAVTLNGTGTLNLNNQSETISRLDTTTSSTVALGTSGNLTLNSGAVVNSTLNGNLTGGGSSSLNISGLSNVSITKDNTGFTGTTNVQAGTLNISANEAVGSGAINVSSGGNLQLQGGINIDNAVTLNGTGTSGNGALQNFGGSNTVSGSVVLGANARVESNTGVLTVSGNLTGSGKTLTVGGTAATTLSGTLAQGSGGLIKTESGTLTLSGANTYTGATSITGGTVIATNSAALGTAANGTTVDSGATLQIQNNINIASEALALNGTLNNASGTNTYGGVISGTGQVQVNAGQLTLSNNNTFSGNIIVANSATLLATSNGALGTGGGTTTVVSGGTLAVQGNVNLGPEANLSLAGTGNGGIGAIRNISGANTVQGPMSLAAATTITSAGGTLYLGDSTGSAGADTIALGANTLTLNTAGGDMSIRSSFSGTGGITKTGSGTLVVRNGQNTNTGTFAVNDGTVLLDTFNDYNNGINGNLVIGDGIGAANSAVFKNGQVEGDLANELIANTSNVTVNADGHWALQGYKETINNLTLDGGSVDAKASNGSGDRLDVIGSITSTSTTQTAVIAGRLGLNNDTGKTINVATGSTLDIQALISNGGFNKTGTGTLMLDGANSFTGNVVVSQGIVQANNNSALGSVTGNSTTVASGAQLQLNNVAIGAEKLYLSGTGVGGTGALLAQAGTTNTWGGTIGLNANAEIETASGANLTVTGGITGSGKTLTVESIGNTTFNGNNTFNTLNKTGAGTLTVNGNNTYAVANVNAGTFAIGASNRLANTMDINVASGATFTVGNFSETIDDLAGAGTVRVGSSGALTIDNLGNGSAFTGTLDVDGVMTLNGGIIGTGASGVLSSGNLILANAGTLNITDDFDFGGTLTLTSGTTLALSGAGTTFNVGALNITGDTVIDFSGIDPTTFNIGTLTISPGVTVSAIGWNSMYDLWTATNFGGATLDERNGKTAQITFNGFSPTDTIWLTHDYGDHEITVPEPSTYGAIFMGLALAGFIVHRRRKQRSA